jgi:hypothetical protein
MAGRQPKQTFADIVRDVEEHPAVVKDATGPDLSSGRAKGPDGRVWNRVADTISEERALELAEAGAAVAYDPCGCGGYCGLDWFTPEQVAALAAGGPPTVKNTKRRSGHLSEWATDDGTEHLVLGEDNVRWGELMAR